MNASVRTIPDTAHARDRLMRWGGLVAVAVAGLAVLFVVKNPLTYSASTDPASDSPVIRPRILATYPHDPKAFCQGLIVHEGRLLEGTGRRGESRLREVELETGKVLREVRLSDREFGEGITVVNGRVYQLTWRAKYMIAYDVETLQEVQRIAYSEIDPRWREGWGITQHDGRVYISDGTSAIRVLDAATFRMLGQLQVRDGLRPVENLNELEFVNGELLSNVWYEDRIARIDPENGRVIGWLDLSHARPRAVRGQREAVLNGIAWDADAEKLYVTGKLWPNLFEIEWPRKRQSSANDE